MAHHWYMIVIPTWTESGLQLDGQEALLSSQSNAFAMQKVGYVCDSLNTHGG